MSTNVLTDSTKQREMIKFFPNLGLRNGRFSDLNWKLSFTAPLFFFNLQFNLSIYGLLTLKQDIPRVFLLPASQRRTRCSCRSHPKAQSLTFNLFHLPYRGVQYFNLLLYMFPPPPPRLISSPPLPATGRVSFTLPVPHSLTYCMSFPFPFLLPRNQGDSLHSNEPE